MAGLPLFIENRIWLEAVPVNRCLLLGLNQGRLEHASAGLFPTKAINKRQKTGSGGVVPPYKGNTTST